MCVLRVSHAERDSPRDQLVVTLFLLTVFGLLLGAGIKGKMAKAGFDMNVSLSTGRKWWEVSCDITKPHSIMPLTPCSCGSVKLRHGFPVHSQTELASVKGEGVSPEVHKTVKQGGGTMWVLPMVNYDSRSTYDRWRHTVHEFRIYPFIFPCSKLSHLAYVTSLSE